MIFALDVIVYTHLYLKMKINFISVIKLRVL
jgi:hypothetical protein